MSRTRQIKNELYRIVKKIHDNTPSYKIAVKNNFIEAIEIWSAMGKLPARISAIKSEHINDLIKYWQDKKYNRNTVVNKKARIMRVVHLAGVMIDENIIIPRDKDPTLQVSNAEPENINIKLLLNSQIGVYTKILLKLQIFFGLTKSEAMQLTLCHTVASTNFIITRDIAFNKKDRIIKIETEEQKLVITALS